MVPGCCMRYCGVARELYCSVAWDPCRSRTRQPSVTAGEDALASAPGAGAVDPLASSLVDPLVAHASGAQPHAASHRAHITFETEHSDPQGLGAHHERVLNGPTYDSSDWQQANKEGEASAKEKSEFFKRRARVARYGCLERGGRRSGHDGRGLWTEITQAASTANEEISKHRRLLHVCARVRTRQA